MLDAPVLPNGHHISFNGGNNGSISSNVSGGTSPYNYAWSTGANTATLSDLEAGDYAVSVSDANGCTGSSSITLSEPLPVDLPTVITPNNDGFNDVLVIQGIEAFPNNELSVFNRWGGLVFNQNNYQNTWAGESNNGGQLPKGTYFVILELNNGDPALTGYLEIRGI